MSNQVSIPTPTTFKYKGKTLLLEPIGARDYMELAGYLRDSYIDEAKKQMKGMPLEMQQFAWKLAKEHTDKLQPGTVEFNAATQTFDALAYLFWLSIRKKQADFTLEMVVDAMQESADTFIAMAEKANKAAGMEAPDPLAVAVATATEQPTETTKN